MTGWTRSTKSRRSEPFNEETSYWHAERRRAPRLEPVTFPPVGLQGLTCSDEAWRNGTFLNGQLARSRGKMMGVEECLWGLLVRDIRRDTQGAPTSTTCPTQTVRLLATGGISTNLLKGSAGIPATPCYNFSRLFHVETNVMGGSI